ncbi:hypothetical protein ECIV_ORF18 [European chub iridovirus]|nr:hypothetical protein ECIV_ORF18 [European chub iridovirus]
MKKPYITLKKLKDTGTDGQQQQTQDDPSLSGGCINCKDNPDSVINDMKNWYGLSNVELVAVAVLIVAIVMFFWNTYSSKSDGSAFVMNRRPFPFQRDFS